MKKYYVVKDLYSNLYLEITLENGYDFTGNTLNEAIYFDTKEAAEKQLEIECNAFNTYQIIEVRRY
jgi:hypothetical protein